MANIVELRDVNGIKVYPISRASAIFMNSNTSVEDMFTDIQDEIDTLNDGGLVLKDDVIEGAVQDWLVNHPEASTTVQDNSLTPAKFTAETRAKTVKDYVTPEMFGAVGDGVTNDTIAIQDAIDAVSEHGGIVFFSAKTYRCDSLVANGHSIVLRGVKSSVYAERGTILQPYNINAEYVLRFGFADPIETSAMRVGNAIENITISGNGLRQDYASAARGKGLVIYHCAELDLMNVYISGFKKNGVYAQDWWDSNILGLEIRACGNPDVLEEAAFYLGSDKNSSNALHFFGLHIEECPQQMYIGGLASNIEFIGSKFELGGNVAEALVTTLSPITIYEGVFAVSFISCFFSHNFNDNTSKRTIPGILVKNNKTSFVGCKFDAILCTYIKNYSGNANYGKGIIVDGCVFSQGIGRDIPLVSLSSNAIFTNNSVECSEGAYIEGAGNNVIENNMFRCANNDNPLIKLTGSRNKCSNKFVNTSGVVYSCTEAGNDLGTMYDKFTALTTAPVPVADFYVPDQKNIIWNSPNTLTLNSDMLLHAQDGQIFKFYVNQGSVVLPTSLTNYAADKTYTAGYLVAIQYINGISKWRVLSANN